MHPGDSQNERVRQIQTGFDAKRILARSTKYGRIPTIAAILSILLVISVFFGRTDREIGFNDGTGADHTIPPGPLTIHQPSNPPIETPAIHSNGRNYSREAYATLLAPADPHPWTLGQPDYYFEACKVKLHRPLRNTTTRDPYNRPVVVLVTPDVLPKQIEILESHGAIIKRVDIIPAPVGSVNLENVNPGYKDQFTKLHIWNMTEYDRIAFFDADTLPIRPIHTIFDTPTVKTGDEEWLFAAVYDSGGVRGAGQRIPPGPEDKGRPEDKDINAGVFLIWPTQKQSDYISYWLRNPPPDQDFTVFMEQDFLRWAYRDDGPYPWVRLSHLFNTQWCRPWDLDTAYVLHDKLWRVHHDTDQDLRKVWYEAWGEMVGWDAPRSPEGILYLQESFGICKNGEL
jgi:inositol 3-alpha-galactosyltransferase